MHLDVTAAIAVIAVFWLATLWLIGSLDDNESEG